MTGGANVLFRAFLYFFVLSNIPVNEYRSSPEACFSTIFQRSEQM